ncbi:MAG: hypothetical protein EPN86_05400 [Nanoarchaeota archaeon]|nr:MAG: hypothetical protein EPN86_05400 [Nanoarchaeota archaeon]
MRRRNYENFDPVGLVMPILSSLFGLIIVLLIIFLLYLFNLLIHTNLVTGIIDFLFKNIALIFVLSVCFSFGVYLSKHGAPVNAAAPLITSIGAILLVFFIVSMLNMILPNQSGVGPIIDMIQTHMLWIFGILLAVGYLAYFIKLTNRD